MKANYILILFFSLTIFGCAVNAQKHATVVFYNVENLFDIYEDPLIKDEEFLPGATVAWTAERYQNKLSNLEKVLSSVSPEEAPAVIGLCEVENRKVLDDLIIQPSLKKANYQVVHYNSPDERGIDCALLYRKSEFNYYHSQTIRVNLSDDKTRDILYVKGSFKISPKDTVHLFVNHWPSRGGGKEVSEPKRVMAAKALRHATDSLFARNPEAFILIMGDFNDEPEDKSLSTTLQVFTPGAITQSERLYNLMFNLYRNKKGTLYYKDWDVFDQFIVSGAFLSGHSKEIQSEKEGKAFDPEWLMFKDENGNLRPNRTKGREYYGGYSDHLAVYLRLFVK